MVRKRCLHIVQLAHICFLDIISNYDIQDPTSIPIKLRNELDVNDEKLAAQFSPTNLKGLTVGVPQEFYVDSLSKEVVDVWRKGIRHLQNLGATIVSVSIPHVSLALPAYYIIALAEASSNLSRYDGIRYGKKKYYVLGLLQKVNDLI